MLLLDYWKDIPGFERYQASYSGKIRHLGKIIQKGRYRFGWAKGRIIDPTIDEDGYYRVTISIFGVHYPKTVHWLIGVTFIDNPKTLKEINHIDCDKLNNRVPNLEWCTHKQNMEHASRMGRLKNVGRKRKPLINAGALPF